MHGKEVQLHHMDFSFQCVPLLPPAPRPASRGSPNHCRQCQAIVLPSTPHAHQHYRLP